ALGDRPLPTQIYTPSLHDALPIWPQSVSGWVWPATCWRGTRRSQRRRRPPPAPRRRRKPPATPRRRPRKASSARTARSAEARKRSEEHTSELQSRENLVCRLLLEK